MTENEKAFVESLNIIYKEIRNLHRLEEVLQKEWNGHRLSYNLSSKIDEIEDATFYTQKNFLSVGNLIYEAGNDFLKRLKEREF